MFFVNERLGVLSETPATPEEFSALPPEVRLEVRNALIPRLDLVDDFVSDNPAGLTDDELEIVRSWRHLVAGKFYIFRELKNYTVLLTSASPSVAYGVVALSQPFEELVGPYLPVLVNAVLLPFKGRIVYDGVMSSYNISFGGGIKRSLNESFKQAKERHGIVTSLPMSTEPPPAKPPKAKAARTPPPKARVDQYVAGIISVTDQFCQEHLNDEYAALCRKLVEKLARKRPSPFLSGQPRTWVCGIIRTIGWVNFLHDKTQSPHMRLADIDAALGVSESTGAAKLTAIRKMLNLRQLDPEWTLPSRMEDNPWAWNVKVNGLIMDIRDCPRELQQMAFEKGLIPYIPADRPSA